MMENKFVRLVGLLLLGFAANIFSMNMNQQQAARAKMLLKRPVQQVKQNQNAVIINELNAADWSAEKIKEFRHKKDSLGKSMYPVRFVATRAESSAAKDFNDALIDHYAQEIYAALQAVPVIERIAWADELSLISIIGLKNFLADGKKRYLAGQLKIIDSSDDGSEIGIFGTKNQALKKVKDETNNLETILFDDRAIKMNTVEFFKSLEQGSKVLPAVSNIVGQQEVSKENQEKIDQELEQAFESDEEHERRKRPQEDTYFIYQQGTTDGIWVSKVIVDKVPLFKDFIDDMGDVENKFAVPYSIEIIQVLFNRSLLKQLSWNQLVAAIKCSDYLSIQYDEKDNKPSEVFVDSACYWINNIGNKLIDLGLQLERHERPSEEIEKDLPDYSIFKNLNDPVLVKAIKSKLFLDKGSCLERYVRDCKRYISYIEYAEGRHFALTPQTVFGTKDSIVDLLDVIFNFVQRMKGADKAKQELQRIEREDEARKWFWQRKSSMYQDMRERERKKEKEFIERARRGQGIDPDEEAKKWFWQRKSWW